MNAYEEGRRDGARGKRNPYVEHTDEWCDWEDGRNDVRHKIKDKKRKDKWNDEY